SMLCVTGSAGLVYFVMRAHMQVRLSRQREKLAAERAEVSVERRLLNETVKNAEEAGRNRAIDGFLSDIRVEERHYVREQKALFLTKKCVVRQERLFFRNIPLSTWIEQEMPFEEGADTDKLVRSMSVFADALLGEAERPVRKLLQ
ncbi:MAG: hypothetical protein KGN84_14170, partial [Acidobacteriota bacterium]|nr:hypothetical protein [Acidobacteriota bacterium]